MSAARHTFLAKPIAAIALIALAQWLFYDRWWGATLGGFALAWIVAFVVARRDVRRSGPALLALGGALVMAAVLVDDPSPLAWVLFWSAVATAALVSRRGIDNAAVWIVRLLAHGTFGLVQPFRDLARLTRRCAPSRASSVARMLAMPLIGGGLFLALFASANPILADAFAAIRLPSLASALMHGLFWSIVLVTIWPSLRPARTVTRAAIAVAGPSGLPRVPTGTLVLSLATFNAVFALQNALDIAFLWSGAALPGHGI